MPISASKLRALAAAMPVDVDTALSLAKLSETTLLEASAAAAQSQQRIMREAVAAMRFADPTAVLRAAIKDMATGVLASDSLAVQMPKWELQELQLAHRANFSPALEAVREFEDTVARSVSQTLRGVHEASKIAFTPPELIGAKQAAAVIAKAAAAARSVRVPDFRSPLQDLVSRIAVQDRAMMELMQATTAFAQRTLGDIQVENLERRTYSRPYEGRPSGTSGPSNSAASNLEISSSSIGIVVHQSLNVNINVSGTVAGRDAISQGQNSEQAQSEHLVEVIWVLQVGDLPNIIGSITMPKSYVPEKDDVFDLQSWPFAIDFVLRGIRKVRVARIEKEYRILQLPSGVWHANGVTLTVFVQPVIMLL